MSGLILNETESNRLLEQQFKKILDIEVEKLTAQIKKQIPIKMKAIKSDIYGAYRTIILNSMQEVFTKAYGNNYDANSLVDSIDFVTGNDIRPDFFWHREKFSFTPEINKDRDFNQNAKDYASFGKIQDPDFFTGSVLDKNYFGWDVEDFNDESNGENDNEDAQEEAFYEEITSLISFKPIHTVGIHGGYASLDEVYQRARTKALDNFNREYVSQIKPRILKKYGIKLG